MEEQQNSKEIDGPAKQKHPYTRANFISKILFIWLFPLFYKGLRKDITESDIFPTLKEHDAAMLGDRIEKEWNRELKGKKDPSLWKALLRVFGFELGCQGVWYMITELFVRLSQPLVLSQLLQYYEPDSTMSVNEAYMYSSLVVLSALVTMISQHNFMLYQFNLGVKIRICASALVYRKTLKLSRSSLVETNIGQMVNLISNDVARFESAVKHIHNLWLAPVEIVIIMILLYFYVGPTGFPGVFFLMVFIPFQMWLGKKSSTYRLNTAIRTDDRIRLMNEIIAGIRVIKMYTWERPFAKLVEISRRKEMRQIQKSSVVRALMLSFQLFINKTAIYLCVLAYVLTGNIVNAQYVYVVTSFYAILRIVVTKRLPEGAMQIAEAGISVQRIRTFLMREEVASDSSGSFLDGDGKPDAASGRRAVKLTDVCVKWNKNSEENSLEKVSVDVARSELAVVVGPVGSGKTTLLQTILRELPPLSGTVEVTGTVSYASQEPWLFMGTIRQNILFGQRFDRARYLEVVGACALETDLALFPFGDRTMVGERGVALSGGQRARINLARCLYKQADVYLLDDPLSAVDARVGKHIFERCVEGYLANRCVILVTHQLQYLRNVRKIYVMNGGAVDFCGTYGDVKNSGKEFAKVIGDELNDVAPEEEDRKEIVGGENVDKRNGAVERAKGAAEGKGGPRAVAEGMSAGTVSMGVYRSYFANGGHWCNVAAMMMVFVLAQTVNSVSDYYLTWWVNAEALRKARAEATYRLPNASSLAEDVNDANPMEPTPFQQFWMARMTENVSVIVYSCLIALLMTLTVGRSLFFFRFCIRASTRLHNRMFDRIVRATMRFFNANPSGRILNRFSKDMNQVDEELPTTMMDTVQNGLTVLFTSIVVATVNPWMTLPTLVILAMLYFLRAIYLATSRNVKRVEGTTRSPVYSHLTASLQGLTTIRAFGAQEILKREFDRHQNRNSSAFITFIAIGRCFGLWLDMHCVVYIALVTMSFLVFKIDTLGGFVGLSITQSLTLTGMFQWCIRQWSELENAMTSVERIKEYIDATPESDENAREPPQGWPTIGSVRFEDVSLRYASDEPSVLENVSFAVEGREKVGIVGRTGAGKSSIVVALFRLAENEGSIAIDGVDIGTISLDRLRSSISIIPQEPVLFSGTLRKNLDPFDDYDDEVLWNALDEVELKEAASDLPGGLESAMSEGGSNFSVGQRQLVCLARAIVRRNRVLVMDEATANVDPRTDALIQATIRKKFADCTVLTVAHRLHTVMDSDKVLVMDAGRVAEFGAPFELLRDGGGAFYEMVQQTGRAMAENLLEIAEKNYQARRRR